MTAASDERPWLGRSRYGGDALRPKAAVAGQHMCTGWWVQVGAQTTAEVGMWAAIDPSNHGASAVTGPLARYGD